MSPIGDESAVNHATIPSEVADSAWDLVRVAVVKRGEGGSGNGRVAPDEVFGLTHCCESVGGFGAAIVRQHDP